MHLDKLQFLASGAVLDLILRECPLHLAFDGKHLLIPSSWDTLLSNLATVVAWLEASDRSKVMMARFASLTLSSSEMWHINSPCAATVVAWLEASDRSEVMMARFAYLMLSSSEMRLINLP